MTDLEESAFLCPDPGSYFAGSYFAKERKGVMYWAFCLLLFAIGIQMSCTFNVPTCREIFSSHLPAKRKNSPGKERDIEVITIEDFYSDAWKLEQIKEKIAKGGLGVVPTDTCYAFVASIDQADAVARLMQLKGGGKKPLSILCDGLSMASKYTANLDEKNVFKMLRESVPGPFTFILPSSKSLPKVIVSSKTHVKRWKRKEIGVRIPNSLIINNLLEDSSLPLLCGSIPGMGEDTKSLLLLTKAGGIDEDEDQGAEIVSSESDSMCDAEDCSEAVTKYKDLINLDVPWIRLVDFVVMDGEKRELEWGRTTIVDLTSGDPVTLREGTL